jgi:hypothetical protein
MTTINSGFGRLLAGAGGALLLVSLFLPWADAAGGESVDGWDLSGATAALFVISALLGLAAALTGGRRGFFRPDVSLNGAADMIAVAAATVLAWLLLFDFPAGADPAAGVYVALVGAIAIATGAGDFRITSLFPQMAGGERTSPSP